MEKLIPPHWFEPLGQITLLLICAASMVVLLKAADWLVTGLAGIAYRMKFSKAVVAATVLSLGTTSPETAVSVAAATANNGSMALGNAVGSVICNLCLIFGLGAVLTSLPADRFVLLRQGGWMVGAALLMSGMAATAYFTDLKNPTMTRWAGMLLLGALAVYLALSVMWGRRHPEGEPFVEQSEEVKMETKPARLDMLIGLCAGGLALVLIASRVFVGGIVVLSEVHWGIPKLVVAATIVSIGTSLPELVVSLTSIYKGHGEVLVGNVIGANIMNILWVIGASLIAAKLPLLADGTAYPRIFLWLHVPVMLGVVGLFAITAVKASRTGRFPRGIGVIFLVIYGGYLTAQLLLG